MKLVEIMTVGKHRSKKIKNLVTSAMNEWGFIGQDIFVGIGKSATINKFKQTCDYMRDERLVLSYPHSS